MEAPRPNITRSPELDAYQEAGPGSTRQSTLAVENRTGRNWINFVNLFDSENVDVPLTDWFLACHGPFMMSMGKSHWRFKDGFKLIMWILRDFAIRLGVLSYTHIYIYIYR